MILRPGETAIPMERGFLEIKQSMMLLKIPCCVRAGEDPFLPTL